MKVLSVRQPWAWAIIHGGKDIENRNWKTPYRGPLAIHAGKEFDFSREERQACRDAQAYGYGNRLSHMHALFDESDANDVRGAIIGVVDLLDCIPSHACDSPWKAGDDPDYWCWRLANPRPLATPVLLKGQLGLFEYPGAILPGHLVCKGCFGDDETNGTCGVCGNRHNIIQSEVPL